jgi:signal transduction histidine kinase/ligand-binding sensor domain-containing protein
MRILFTVIIGLFAQVVSAQQRMAFTRIRTDDGSGLASNVVYSLFQDKKGFIWAGTANGLQRFDGTKFISFTTDKPGSDPLPQAGISQIIDAGNGKVMLSLSSLREFGIFDLANFTYKKIPLKVSKPISPRAQFRIWKNAEGEIFMTVLKYGILYYDRKAGVFTDNPFFELPANWMPAISGVFEDSINRRIWIACDSGLCVYNKATKEIWNRDFNPAKLPVFNNPVVHNLLNTFYIDKKRRNWVIGWSPNGQFVHCLDSAGSNFLAKDTMGLHTGPVGYKEYAHFFETSRNGFWIYGMGVLFNWDNEQKKFIFNKSDFRNDEVSINYESVYQVLEDRDGSIWIATDRGLFITSVTGDDLSVANLIFGNDKESISITDILEMPDGKIWFTSWGTGVRTVDKFLRPVANDLYRQAPPASWPASLKGTTKLTWTMHYQSSKGKIWIGCNEGILMIHDPVAKTTEYSQPEAFNKSTIRYITEDIFGQIWLGTQSGRLVRYFNNEFTVVLDVGTIIYKVYIDHQGWMWLATHEKGLYAVNPINGEIMQHYTSAAGNGKLFSNTGYDIEQLNDSIIVYGAGALNFINKKTKSVRLLMYEQGLPSNNVSRLRMDQSGFLWIVTANGLCRYNPNNDRITSYGKKDGIILAEQASTADFTCRNGNLLFGGSNAVIMFHPSAFSNTSPPPDVSITDFRLFDTYYPVDSLIAQPVIKLNHNQNSFSIFFSSLSYMQRDKLTYYYKMEGIDKAWRKADRWYYENYSLLPPGKYTFKVYCENLEGMRSKHTTEIQIYIRPPFWRTWWFRCCVLFLVALIVFDLHNARVKRLLAVEKLRNKVARDLHDDMGSTLSTINILSSMAKTKMNTDQVKASEYLGKITDNSQRMMEAMDDIVWSIKPSNDSMQKITARMREFATNVLEAKDIEIKFDVDDKVYDEKLNMESRRDFFLVFKEAVNNAAKYSKASMVWVSITSGGKKLVLTVKDNGIGFDVAAADGGNGMGNMRKRAESMQGQVQIKSVKGQGTEVIVKIPIS